MVCNINKMKCTVVFLFNSCCNLPVFGVRSSERMYEGLRLGKNIVKNKWREKVGKSTWNKVIKQNGLFLHNVCKSE